MDAPVEVSTTPGGGRSRSVRAAALGGVVLVDAVVVDQGGACGGSGVIHAQRGSEPGCPWEGGQTPEATPTQL
ncbi:hypothetical protein GCM10009609_28490 [Pseudonocardia aurantiaca]|uniref:Uncharacterized protein n=1 Tax=Pseudonocardia aurantiaca TaxID=75290 RepID=A0ABW4FIN9_9PSEU